MTTFKAPLTVCMLCMLSVLAGCHRESSAPATPVPAAGPRPPAAVAQRSLSAEEQTAGMVEAAAQGKSSLPVVLKFDLAARPVVGEPFDIGLALVPGVPAALATIEVTVSDGLKVADGSAHIEIPSVEATQVYRQSVKVTASAEGVAFVTLKVTLMHEQISESRVFAVPIIVAAPAPSAQNPAH